MRQLLVLQNGKLKHIDIAYALMNRNRKAKENYFMKSFDELKRICEYRTIFTDMNGVYENLKTKSKNIQGIKYGTPGFKMESRTDSTTETLRR